jgi:hypothetical protein
LRHLPNTGDAYVIKPIGPLGDLTKNTPFLGTYTENIDTYSATANVCESGGDAIVDVGRIFNSDSAHADGFGHGCEIGILKIRSRIEKAGRLLLELDETERAVIEHDHFHGQSELNEAQIAHEHGEPTVAGKGDHRLPANAACAPIAWGIAFAMDPCQNEPMN